jgi:predicted RND superfamily exporter protein
VRRAEGLVVPATLILLLVAFGSLVAAVIPLAVGQLAIATTLAITGLLARGSTCPSWCRIWPLCSAWDWELTMRSSWSAASVK